MYATNRSGQEPQNADTTALGSVHDTVASSERENAQDSSDQEVVSRPNQPLSPLLDISVNDDETVHTPQQELQFMGGEQARSGAVTAGEETSRSASVQEQNTETSTSDKTTKEKSGATVMSRVTNASSTNSGNVSNTQEDQILPASSSRDENLSQSSSPPLTSHQISSSNEDSAKRIVSNNTLNIHQLRQTLPVKQTKVTTTSTSNTSAALLTIIPAEARLNQRNRHFSHLPEESTGPGSSSYVSEEVARAGLHHLGNILVPETEAVATISPRYETQEDAESQSSASALYHGATILVPETEDAAAISSQNEEQENAAAATQSSASGRHQGDGPQEPDITLDEEEEALYCRVCRDRRCRILLLPCQHFVCCMQCASNRLRCPVCRTRIRGTMNVSIRSEPQRRYQR